jgi:hypothetical protein
MRLSLGFDTQRQMNRHLVTVEVGIEASAGQWVKHNGIAFHKDRLKRLNTHSMKSWGPIEQNRMLMNNFLQNVPDLVITTLNHPLGTFYRISKAMSLELANYERLVQLKRYSLRQTTLIELQVRPHHNDRTS